jgi:hypothetical protein
VSAAWRWLEGWAEKSGFSYEEPADERWLRAFEPFVTLRTPIRYGHVLHATGPRGSLSIARFTVEAKVATPDGPREEEVGAWIAFVQDERVQGHAAATNDVHVHHVRWPSPFAEPMDLVSMPRVETGDRIFDRAFATFAPAGSDVGAAVTPSLRKLTIGWSVPVHFEVRPGAFLLAPVTLGGDPKSLGWLVAAVQFFGEKASKRVK